MTNNKYAKAYKEVLEIIKYFPEEEYNKIPKEKIEFYEVNKDQNYQFIINPKIDLSGQNISKEANAIIVTLFQDYFATAEQKEKIKEILELNEKKSEQEKREKYNAADIFKGKTNISKDNEIVTESNLPIEVKKDNFFKRFIDYIRNLFIKTKQ